MEQKEITNYEENVSNVNIINNMAMCSVVELTTINIDDVLYYDVCELDNILPRNVMNRIIWNTNKPNRIYVKKYDDGLKIVDGRCKKPIKLLVAKNLIILKAKNHISVNNNADECTNDCYFYIASAWCEPGGMQIHYNICTNSFIDAVDFAKCRVPYFIDYGMELNIFEYYINSDGKIDLTNKIKLEDYIKPRNKKETVFFDKIDYVKRNRVLKKCVSRYLFG